MKKLLFIFLLLGSMVSAKAQNADSLFKAGKYDKAIEAWKTSYIDNKDFKTLRRVGFCYLNIEGGKPYAITYFERALKVEPKDATTYYLLGLCYVDDDKNKAKSYFETATQLGSEDAKQELFKLQH
ncbi:MAG: hypothetical protein IE931_05620 [Sphingobacteriales bacterium]|nr:hypothetical protein [Sphingobacteriales bacterium]